jgi:homoserine kinase type II
MAVYTDVTDIELKAFLAGYNIGELTSYRGIAEGVENSNFMLHTTKGQFILTLYEKRVNEADLPFFLGLMQHLQTRGLVCPLPVLRNDGSMIGKLAGRPAAIITFLEGTWPRLPTANHCRQLGVVLAKMHVAGADFKLTRRNGLTLEDWRPLWDKCADFADNIVPGLLAEAERDLKDLEAGWPRDLPRGVIHADLFPDNVFFLGDKLSGIIDFYFACTDILAYDLATCLNAWCFDGDGAFNIAKGVALFEGYQSVRKLSADEMAALPLLARGSALRFMLTRLYDWINTPEGSLVVKKDPKEYSRKMAFHRSVNSASAYGLSVHENS